MATAAVMVAAAASKRLIEPFTQRLILIYQSFFFSCRLFRVRILESSLAMSFNPLSLTKQCWHGLQTLVVSIVMRVLQAAFYELALSDSRVKAEMSEMDEGGVYELTCFGASPQLIMQVQSGVLVYKDTCPQRPLCAMVLKSLPIAFRLFTGQLGIASSNAQHGFTMAGDVAATMRFVRLVCIAEAYLFPPVIAKYVLIDVPEKEGSSIVLYLKIIGGLLINKYSKPRP